MEYFFEIKNIWNIANREVVLSFEDFTAKIFYTKCAENWAKTQVAIILASEATTMIMM